MVCVPSVVTIASATPAATACCAANATFCDLVAATNLGPTKLSLLDKVLDLASLPSLENLLTRPKAPRPGIAN